jgi:glycosyltransferase involved in cell wall biosynthesis
MESEVSVIIPVYKTPLWTQDFIAQFNNLKKKLITDNNYSILLVFISDGNTIEFENKFKSQLHNLEIPYVFLRHYINRGQGASLQTGISFLRDVVKTKYIVTFDGDMQHRPKDIERLIATIEEDNKLDIVFGNRFLNMSKDMPFMRRIILKFASYFERVLTGINLADAHNGLRCIRSRFALKINLTQDRMAHATEFKQITKRYKASYSECAVTIDYSKESLQRGQKNIDSIRILSELFERWLLE